MAAKTIDDINPAGKRVLVRVDLNVPVKQGKVSDATRIERILPTIRELVRKDAKVILLAHFGRPKGRPASEMSLRPIAAEIGRLIDRPVKFAPDCIGEPARTAVAGMKNGDVVLLENTRFHEGEETNDAQFAARLAENGDLYVNDAFSAAHRAHASTEGIARLLPAYAGRSLQAELDALQAGLENPAHPVAAVVGGAKVSTKINLLENLLTRVDSLVIGGGMANTFLYAQGYEIGNSLCERDLAETAGRIMSVAESTGCRIVLPSDVVVAEAFRANSPHDTVPVSAIPQDRMVLDLGPDSLAEIESVFEQSATLVWNGPLGAFELPPFDAGTVTAARTAARLTGEGKLFSVAGGGDTVAALNHAGVANAFNYVSTAGGAFLEWLEGKRLPGIAVLQR